MGYPPSLSSGLPPPNLRHLGLSSAEGSTIPQLQQQIIQHQQNQNQHPPPHPQLQHRRQSLHNQAEGAPPFAVPVHSLLSRVSPLPPGVPFPSISLPDQKLVKAFIEADTKYEKALGLTKIKARAELTELAEDVFLRQDWLGPSSTLPDGGPGGGGGKKMRIRFEGERGKERERGKRGQNRKEVKWGKEDGKKIAHVKEVLIPVRIEVEFEAYKLRDTFTWNLRGNSPSSLLFSSNLALKTSHTSQIQQNRLSRQRCLLHT